MDEPHVLLTNDDGIDSLGLARLYERLAGTVEVTVVAPAEDHSGVGRRNAYAVEVRAPMRSFKRPLYPPEGPYPARPTARV